MFASQGVRREISSKRASGRSTPARPAMATRWMMAFVEPPIAMSTVIALSKEAAVRMSDGFRSSQTISTIRRPVAAAMTPWLASGAGIEDAPGRVRPRVSAMDIMVAAVPMVMQVPDDRAVPASTSSTTEDSTFPARYSA